MIKRPSFPVYRALPPVPRRSFDHRLTVGTIALAIVVAAALLVKTAVPAPETPPDSGTAVAAP